MTIIQICAFILETNVYGDIKMGFMVSKGQLEIDIIVVKGLKKTGLVQPPGNWQECYLYKNYPYSKFPVRFWVAIPLLTQTYLIDSLESRDSDFP